MGLRMKQRRRPAEQSEVLLLDEQGAVRGYIVKSAPGQFMLNLFGWYWRQGQPNQRNGLTGQFFCRRSHAFQMACKLVAQ